MKEVTQKYKDMQKKWRKMEKIWGVVNLFVGLSAASLAFIAGSEEIRTLVTDAEIAAALSLASGLMVVIMTFLSPASKRKGYTEACNLMRVIRLMYEQEDIYTNKDLNDALEEAQQMVSSG